MESSGGWPAVLDDVEESLRRDPDVEFAVVFGSHLADDARPSSDVDLAVKFSDALSSNERFRKRCSLSGELQRDDTPFVDVSDLESLPLDVAHDAVQGELVCGDAGAFREFKSDVEGRFEDERDEIRRRQRDVIDRIADDGLHG